jgi:hypothetical protein
LADPSTKASAFAGARPKQLPRAIDAWQTDVPSTVVAMSDLTIRPAYRTWPDYNKRFRDVVAELTKEQLAIHPSPDRWPIWATVGHTACQRVFWLCDFAGEPGAETPRHSLRRSTPPSGSSRTA